MFCDATASWSVERAERALQLEMIAEEQRAAEAARLAEKKLCEASRCKGKQAVKAAASRRAPRERMAQARRRAAGSPLRADPFKCTSSVADTKHCV